MAGTTPVSGLTTVDLFKSFWPDVASDEYFESDQLNAAIKNYIARAEALLNLLGDIDTSLPAWTVNSQLAANLLVKRLILADNHPAAYGTPAGVVSESAAGASYSVKTASTLQELLGPEVVMLMSTFLEGDVASALDTEVLFAAEDELVWRNLLELTGDVHIIGDPASIWGHRLQRQINPLNIRHYNTADDE